MMMTMGMMMMMMMMMLLLLPTTGELSCSRFTHILCCLLNRSTCIRWLSLVMHQDKADREDMQDLKDRLAAQEAAIAKSRRGRPPPSERGSRGKGSKRGTAKKSGSWAPGGTRFDTNGGDDLPAASREMPTQELTPADLADMQRRLEQRLSTLQSIFDHRGWGVRDSVRSAPVYRCLIHSRNRPISDLSD